MQSPSWPQEYHSPWQLNFFMLYLLIVLAVGAARSISLGWQLLWFGSASRKKDGESAKANLLARSALGNRRFASLSDPSLSLRELQIAEDRFLYLWEMCLAKVGTLKRLTILTLLLSVLVVTSLATGVLMTPDSNRSLISDIAENMAKALSPLVLGVFVSSVLYFAASLYEGMLARRRASWKYFCARIKTTLPAIP